MMSRKTAWPWFTSSGSKAGTTTRSWPTPRVHAVRHDGSYYQSNAIHLSEPSPQRTPLLFQAGTSEKGKDFASRHAEAVFLNGRSKPNVQAHIADIADAPGPPLIAARKFASNRERSISLDTSALCRAMTVSRRSAIVCPRLSSPRSSTSTNMRSVLAESASSAATASATGDDPIHPFIRLNVESGHPHQRLLRLVSLPCDKCRAQKMGKCRGPAKRVGQN
jgi:hypothetical protein